MNHHAPTPEMVVRRYAEKFAETFDTIEASSPLGAWLLLALLAPAAEQARARLEELLGTSIEHASEVADTLLRNTPEAVSGAIGLWYRKNLLNDLFTTWEKSLSTVVERSSNISKEELDAWADKHTRSMIQTFPAPVGSDNALVFANALATDVNWERPYDIWHAADLGGDFGKHVRTILCTDEANTVGRSPCTSFWQTTAAGLVVGHRRKAKEGLTLLSVIGPEDAQPYQIHAAALEIQARSARAVPLSEVPAGKTTSWDVVAAYGESDSTHTFLPSWRTDSDPYVIAGAPGYTDVMTAVHAMLTDKTRVVYAAQKVYAEYTAAGFRAAAVTVITDIETGALPRFVPCLRAEVRFNRPYAVLAYVTPKHEEEPWSSKRETGPWDGVPVFSAWVTGRMLTEARA